MKREDTVNTIINLEGESGHNKVMEVYNSQSPLPRGYKLKKDDPWCAGTVSAVFLMNGCSDFSECSCDKMISKAKKAGLWVEDDSYTANVGDVILYDWQDDGKGDNTGTPDHVGIIINIDDEFTVREGNKKGTIANRRIPINGKFIRGFITPVYEEAVSEVKEEPQESQGAVSPGTTTEAKKKQEKGQGTYTPGNTYTVAVTSALNVRTGPGIDYPLVGYKNLTADGKKHAYSSGALKPYTRVTCNDVKTIDSKNIWIKIPSGWICAVSNGKVLVV